MIDGYDGDRELMADPEGVRALTNAISGMLGQVTQEPYVLPYFDGKTPEDCGVSATVLFEGGGHGAIHTFSEKRTVFVDFATPGAKIGDCRDEISAMVKRAMKLGELDQFETLVGDQRGQLPDCFGPHFIANGKFKKPPTFEQVYDMIANLPPAISMTPISKPQVIKHENGGTTGLGLIAESHIALHMDGEGEFAFDVFSCKPFDLERLADLLSRWGMPLDDVSLRARGLHFPR